MNVISEMRKRALTPDGKRFRPSALSRIAEFLSTPEKECSRETIKRVFLGDETGKLWKFSDARMKALERMITLEIPLTRREGSGRRASNGAK